MKQRRRHTDVESARVYRKASALLSGGGTITQACRKLEISEATFHRWRRKFALPARVSPARASPEPSPSPEGNGRLKQLEKENKRLKLLLAELTLENSFLKDRLEDPPH